MWDDGQLQHWAHALGIGRPTGIDLPGARGWACCPRSTGATSSTRKAKPNGRGRAGDNVQLATGQGDLQTNPLQMAVAYATIANGGTVVTPHVGPRNRRRGGPRAEGIRPRAAVATSRSTPNIAKTILEGLHDAAQNGGGTSFDVFGNFPIPVAGKTGTAQRPAV